ncbi:MAG: ATP-binding protein [Methylobacter tundripaludum]|uniref:AAA ATPase-like protein n=1 Tax=Methylobacter tundripaludum TaxID=173365 RepID=A0A2S6H5Y6_9GAMM|nr:AAA family ATPase [Methylobacter tundripaludum]MCK9635221.1 ATP-binding protein [Methylobacter tundripaludum]PPK72899.1 AAA ATPase-like protein [Methylobacter tundripaludum]
MKIDVKVKNLGKLKEAEFKIRPMTVITGPNGTGKSFFTKSLYSILNVINKNVYHESVNKTIRQIQLQLQTFANGISYVGQNDLWATKRIELTLDKLQKEFEEASSWKIDDYLAFATSKVGDVEKIHTYYETYLNELKPTKRSSIKSISEAINKNFDDFLRQLINPQKYYADFFAIHIENELKDNFQISTLSELISFDEEKIIIAVDDLLVIELSGNKRSFSLGADFIDEVSGLSSVVFFESPAYWKVRDALKSAKNNQIRPRLLGKKNSDVLTGVPKYFYDLDDALNTKTKTSGAFAAATDLLEDALGGEFIFKGDNLSFKDNKSGQEISKNLVSFGMTNLGMVQALLKHNVITEGSFVFIDEPETNLHPDWQVKLMEVLLVLAQAGVNIVITTHSTDLLKALEVNLKKQKIDVEDFLSVHFVDLDGKLFEFESKNSDQQLIEARELLNSAYEQLYFSDL